MTKIDILTTLCAINAAYGFTNYKLSSTQTLFNSFIATKLSNKHPSLSIIINSEYEKKHAWRFKAFSMTMTTEDKEAQVAPIEPKVVPANDFSMYSIGQEYEGTLLSAKNFGLFVDISTGTNVLLPRSLMTSKSYDKLKKLVETKSKETVKLSIVGVSAENQTLSGKYLPNNYQARSDISKLDGKDIADKFFNATVVSAHEFGVFAEIDEFGVEGLIPASKLNEKGPNIIETYT
jgi:predicted RNA-binding protein with RPS1 domain